MSQADVGWSVCDGAVEEAELLRRSPSATSARTTSEIVEPWTRAISSIAACSFGLIRAWITLLFAGPRGEIERVIYFGRYYCVLPIHTIPVVVSIASAMYSIVLQLNTISETMAAGSLRRTIGDGGVMRAVGIAPTHASAAAAPPPWHHGVMNDPHLHADPPARFCLKPKTALAPLSREKAKRADELLAGLGIPEAERPEFLDSLAALAEVALDAYFRSQAESHSGASETQPNK